MSSIYSAADADNDCSELLQDFDKYFNSSLDIGQFHATVLHTPPEVRKVLSEHIESLRFVKFATSSLSVEHHNISRNPHSRNSKRAVSNELSPEPQLDRRAFFSRLPFEIDLYHLSKRSKTLSNAYESEISMKQLRRDLERDRVVLNGRRIVGAMLGLDGLIAAVGDCIDSNLSHCGLPPFVSTLRDRVSVAVLRMACRTNSGGLCFHALRALVDPTDVMLVPVSTLARLLCIKISVDSFVDHSTDGTGTGTALYFSGEGGSGSNRDDEYCSDSVGKLKWGLCCEVQGSTFFNLISLSGHDTAAAPDSGGDRSGDVVEAVYKNLLCVEIDSRLKSIQDAALLGGLCTEGVCGKLMLRLHQG